MRNGNFSAFFYIFAQDMEAIYPVVSIGRSFGAGGRAIGKCLSTMTGIPVYDRELLKESAEEFGFSKEIFIRADEKRPSRFRRLVTQTYGVQEAYLNDTLSPENLYQAQSLVIRAIAKRGPCIMIGRTADYILRDFPGLLKIFVHAPVAYRARKIVERGDAANDEEAIELARQKDKERQNYYNYFTGRKWGEASNYDLTLDSSLLTPQENADFISQYLKKVVK